MKLTVRLQEHPLIVALHQWLEITFPCWPADILLRSALARVWKNFFIHQGTKKNGVLLIYLLCFKSFLSLSFVHNQTILAFRPDPDNKSDCILKCHVFKVPIIRTTFLKRDRSYYVNLVPSMVVYSYFV